MTSTYHPISIQSLLPNSNSVSIRIMFLSAEYVSDIINIKKIKTLVIDCVRVTIKRNLSEKSNWARFDIVVDTPPDTLLALDLNFMGKRFTFDAPFASEVRGDELCFDIDVGQTRHISVWVSPGV